MVINKICNLIHKKVILTGSAFSKPLLIGINQISTVNPLLIKFYIRHSRTSSQSDKPVITGVISFYSLKYWNNICFSQPPVTPPPLLNSFKNAQQQLEQLEHSTCSYQPLQDLANFQQHWAAQGIAFSCLIGHRLTAVLQKMQAWLIKPLSLSRRLRERRKKKKLKKKKRKKINKAELRANPMFHTPCPAEGAQFCRSPLQPRGGPIWPRQGLGKVCWCLVLALVMPKVWAQLLASLMEAAQRPCQL